jgi:acyl-coenzyme A thioesterase PaaI-like protein
LALRRLDNASWGFESNCFVCEAGNQHGLRIPFFHDEEAGLVVADYELEESFSGTPRYVHGGLTMTVLDEAMAWAVIAEVKAFGLTRRSTTRFLRPLKVGERCRVEARVAGRKSDAIVEAAAVVRNAEGRTAAESQAEFALMSPGQAADAIGDLTGPDTDYVKD